MLRKTKSAHSICFASAFLSLFGPLICPRSETIYRLCVRYAPVQRAFTWAAVEMKIHNFYDRKMLIFLSRIDALGWCDEWESFAFRSPTHNIQRIASNAIMYDDLFVIPIRLRLWESDASCGAIWFNFGGYFCLWLRLAEPTPHIKT